MKQNTKVMRWSAEHRDHYAYEDGQWVKVACYMVPAFNICVAPRTYPRGAKFDYNGKLK